MEKKTNFLKFFDSRKRSQWKNLKKMFVENWSKLLFDFSKISLLFERERSPVHSEVRASQAHGKVSNPLDLCFSHEDFPYSFEFS